MDLFLEVKTLKGRHSHWGNGALKRHSAKHCLLKRAHLHSTCYLRSPP